jgi:hypothetical protein
MRIDPRASSRASSTLRHVDFARWIGNRDVTIRSLLPNMWAFDNPGKNSGKVETKSRSANRKRHSRVNRARVQSLSLPSFFFSSSWKIPGNKKADTR